MARPRKYQKEVVNKIVEAISVGSPFIHACNYAGISFDTFNTWHKTKPEFFEAVKKAEGEAVKGWLDKIESAANDGNWQAAAWKLERRYADEFARRDRLQIDVKQLDSEIEQELAALKSQSEQASELIN